MCKNKIKLKLYNDLIYNFLILNLEIENKY